MQTEFKNVTLIYTDYMQQEGKYGYSYSFIVDRGEYIKAVRKCVANNKKCNWVDSMGDADILEYSCATDLEKVSAEIKALLEGTDNIILKVKGKQNGKPAPIIATVTGKIPWFSKANIMVDIYPCAVNRNRYITRVSPAFCSVQITKLGEPMPTKFEGYKPVEGVSQAGTDTNFDACTPF